ncbi:MAG: methyltransferase domain-containing protein [Burkholderiales bacterium]
MTSRLADFYDAELRRHNEHFRAAVHIRMRDRVLDVGCGAGQSSRDAARMATRGSVIGVEVSGDMLEAARRRSIEEGLRNVAFEQGDAQTMAFPPDHFDVCISRFGVMFFANPTQAFMNVGRALRAGGRLALLVWQNHERNEWATAIHRALTPGSAVPGSGVAAFSLGDHEVATSILLAAGFVSIDFTEVREPVFYGHDAETAYDNLVGLQLLKHRLSGVDELTAGEALQRLRDLLNAHVTAEGVLFDSRSWIIAARRAR